MSVLGKKHNIFWLSWADCSLSKVIWIFITFPPPTCVSWVLCQSLLGCLSVSPVEHWIIHVICVICAFAYLWRCYGVSLDWFQGLEANEDILMLCRSHLRRVGLLDCKSVIIPDSLRVVISAHLQRAVSNRCYAAQGGDCACRPSESQSFSSYLLLSQTLAPCRQNPPTPTTVISFQQGPSNKEKSRGKGKTWAIVFAVCEMSSWGQAIGKRWQRFELLEIVVSTWAAGCVRVWGVSRFLRVPGFLLIITLFFCVLIGVSSTGVCGLQVERSRSFASKLLLLASCTVGVCVCVSDW